MDKEKKAFDTWRKETKIDDSEIQASVFGTLILSEDKDINKALIGTGFYAGYHSRDDEIERLEAELWRISKWI